MLHPLFSVINADMQAVDLVIKQRLHSEIPLISQVGDYIIAAGGKRLRPAIHLLFAGALGFNTQEKSWHHELAAVVEFIHTATLLHDDVVDESTLRRGRETANAVFGNATPVLVGDFLYSRAFQMMVNINQMRVMQILSDATNIIAEGEVLQLINCNDPDVDEARYLQVIRYKTAKLFEAAAQLAAIICNSPSETEKSCASYGRHMGTAFQIIDDILDYTGKTDEIGKNVGDDLREGKPTLPLIYLLKHGDQTIRSHAYQAISEGGLNTSTTEGQKQFDLILNAIQTTGALDYAHQQAVAEATLAKESISQLTNSAYKEALIALCDFATQRTV